MPSIVGKITAGIAGTTGTGGLSGIVFGLVRMASKHPVPDGLWAAMATLITVSALVACLGLILEYRLRKLAVETQHQEAQSAAELKMARLEMHRTVLEKAAGEPASAHNYRELIIADALHLSVEQNGARLADRTHAQLYGPGGAASN